MNKLINKDKCDILCHAEQQWYYPKLLQVVDRHIVNH